MPNKSFILKIIYKIRDIRSSNLFSELDKYCHGDVLDVGGGDFYLRVKRRLHFTSWTTLEVSKKYKIKTNDANYHFATGKGDNLKFKSNTFDTVLCIQVLEHTLEPIKVFMEIARVLKKGGHAIYLIPHTSTLHMIPHHYYSFTNFWIRMVAKKSGLKIMLLSHQGGLWSTFASMFVFLFFKSLGNKTYTPKKHQRFLFFYLFFPFMWIWAAINIIVCLIFSIGDLTEEPNNYLVVFKK